MENFMEGVSGKMEDVKSFIQALALCDSLPTGGCREGYLRKQGK
jgi:hypothetical protein